MTVTLETPPAYLVSTFRDAAHGKTLGQVASAAADELGAGAAHTDLQGLTETLRTYIGSLLPDGYRIECDRIIADGPNGSEDTDNRLLQSLYGLLGRDAAYADWWQAAVDRWTPTMFRARMRRDRVEITGPTHGHVISEVFAATGSPAAALRDSTWQIVDSQPDGWRVCRSTSADQWSARLEAADAAVADARMALSQALVQRDTEIAAAAESRQIGVAEIAEHITGMTHDTVVEIATS